MTEHRVDGPVEIGDVIWINGFPLEVRPSTYQCPWGVSYLLRPESLERRKARALEGTLTERGA